MKIALISSFALKTPPVSYGGLERCWYEHALGLSELGHDVTLIAAKGSKAPPGVKLLEMVDSWDSLPEEARREYAKKDRVWNGWRAHEEEAYSYYQELLPNYDVIADATWSKWAYLSKKDEVVGTCHSIRPYNVAPPREFPMLTGVSRAHSRFLSSQLHRPVRTVWNPVNVEEFQVRKDKEERIVSLNRIMPAKGIHLFADAVEKAKVKADVVGDDSTLVPDQNYVAFIKEKCKKSAYLSYYGLVDDVKRAELIGRAKAMVCMKDGGYEEIFGIQAVEALSSGTPVIAMKSWGFEDTIENGKTGILCDTTEQVVTAIQNVMNGTVKFEPEACRAGAERFSRKVVTKEFEKMLVSVKNGSRW